MLLALKRPHIEGQVVKFLIKVFTLEGILGNQEENAVKTPDSDVYISFYIFEPFLGG
jgi:hypothetical protein